MPLALLASAMWCVIAVLCIFAQALCCGRRRSRVQMSSCVYPSLLCAFNRQLAVTRSLLLQNAQFDWQSDWQTRHCHTLSMTLCSFSFLLMSLETNRQSSFYDNVFSQNTAPMGKTAPNHTITMHAALVYSGVPMTPLREAFQPILHAVSICVSVLFAHVYVRSCPAQLALNKSDSFCHSLHFRSFKKHSRPPRQSMKKLPSGCRRLFLVTVKKK